ncbi:MAG: 2-C-methyl-D-erythritol 4-phosphate cytidylyltransferase [Muribaculaceae bacterium]|nr:2-C-methyl-D-erythritol 4-phosphate cytidylyltransferase [Muribaculaceae bacterium]
MKNTGSRIAVILAGGTGTRMGHKLPKQYIEVDGEPIIHYTLLPFIKSGLFENVVVCADDLWHDYILEHLPQNAETANRKISLTFSRPGETRQLTIFNALKKIKEEFPDCKEVLIHDAARPLVTIDLLSRCIEGLKETDGVLPVVKVKDTIYQSHDGKDIDSLLDRSTLYAGQSPESFKFLPYLHAHLESSEKELMKINGSSELAMLKGMKVGMIPGEEDNFKITTREDLERFKQFLESNR